MVEIAKIDGNQEDGWNIVANMDGYRATLACEDREDAEELRHILNRLSWFTVVPLPGFLK